MSPHAIDCDMGDDCTCGACGCGPIAGVLWPWSTDGDDSRDWVERCDECHVFADDEAAAEALGAWLGAKVSHAPLHGDGRPAPYVSREDLPSWALMDLERYGHIAGWNRERQEERNALRREARQEALLDAGPILAEHRRAKGE